VSDDLDRLLVPGSDAARRSAVGTEAIAGLQPEYLHPDAEFAFDPVVRDLARTYDIPTAHFAAKTMEYPVADVQLTGRSWPWLPTLVFFGLIALGSAIAWTVSRRFRKTSPAVPETLPDSVEATVQR
jgi:hypothetical protein